MGMRSHAISLATRPRGNMFEEQAALVDEDLPSPPVLTCPCTQALLSPFFEGMENDRPLSSQKAPSWMCSSSQVTV